MSREADPLEPLRRAIANYADAESAGILAEAQAEARAKVRSVLVDAIAERLLERTRAELDAVASQTGAPYGSDAEPDPRQRALGSRPSRVAESPSRPAGDGWYVYGVARELDEVQPLAGIDGVHPIELIREGHLAAVASRVSLAEFGEDALSERLEDLEWLEQNARAHEYVLDMVREQVTLVPMRLCTIYRSEQSVREMLAREHHFLADALTRLTGRTEWGVKIFARADGQAGDSPSQAQGDLGDAGPGERYLLGRRLEQRHQEEAARELEHRVEQAHERLAAVAVEARLNPLQAPELTNREGAMALNGVYLVDDTASDEFAATVAALREEYADGGVEIELTGPWPPYNFVNSSSEVGR